MIELDTTSDYYKAEFARYVEAPTHAHIIMIRWGLPLPDPSRTRRSAAVRLDPHIEAVYVFGRLHDDEFIQTEGDVRLGYAHAAMDMTEYETEVNLNNLGEPSDPPEFIQEKERRKRVVAIKETLLADHEGPHEDDPVQRVPSPHGKNRFSERDLDIVFSHTDTRLKGKVL